ncbi:MAG: SH3 domain-containing protein [Leptospirales bacterium]|nr:SH3 domain-containing protein [Leptospirales bacterium]
MKKEILISSISVVALFCFISLLILSTHSVNAADGDEKYVAAKSGINLRSGAGKSSSAITLIPFGSKVTIEKSEDNEIFLDGRYGKWVNVKFGTKAGWVFSGFLCDFKPDTVIKPAADYYRSKYKDKYAKSANACESELIKFGDDQVYIKNIIDNYIHLQVPTTCGDEVMFGDVVWRYDIKQKKFLEVKNFGYYGYSGTSSNFFHLDNDKYPDFVVQGGMGQDYGIHVFLGTENGFKEVYDSKGDCNTFHGNYLTEDSCGKMKFVCSKTYDQSEGGVNTMYFFRFNCDKKKVEKYAESKITGSDGVIKSIDFKNMTVVINEYHNSKDASFKFSDKRFTTDGHFKYLKTFKKNDGVSIYYETVNGKKMILDIMVLDYD